MICHYYCDICGSKIYEPANFMHMLCNTCSIRFFGKILLPEECNASIIAFLDRHHIKGLPHLQNIGVFEKMIAKRPFILYKNDFKFVKNIIDHINNTQNKNNFIQRDAYCGICGCIALNCYSNDKYELFICAYCMENEI